MRASAVAVILLTALSCGVAAAADLDLLVRYQTRSVDAAAVTRSEQWQDRLIVRENHVWTQRLGTRGHDEAPEAHDGHRHFDFALAAQHLRRGPRGELVAEYVDPHSRVVVLVPATEYAAVGFNGSWDGAAALIPPAVVQRMPVLARAAPHGGSWREEKRDGWYTRVLWDERQHYARIVESGRLDGSIWRRIVAEPAPKTPAAQLPWLQLGTYQHKDYDDFMD